jgi:hypothetical protein
MIDTKIIEIGDKIFFTFYPLGDQGEKISKLADFLYSGVFEHGEYEFVGIFEFWSQEEVELVT